MDARGHRIKTGAVEGEVVGRKGKKAMVRVILVQGCSKSVSCHKHPDALV